MDRKVRINNVGREDILDRNGAKECR